MDARTRAVFLALIVAQAAHSIEEHCFRLYDVFAPARFVSGLFSADHGVGFAIGNVLLVAFGAWSYAARVRPNRPSGRAFAWFWALLELGNGSSHIFFSLARHSYFPGVATAPFLLGISSYLCARLSAMPREGGNA